MATDTPSFAQPPTKIAAVEALKTFYRNFSSASLDDIGLVYSDDVVFCDPVQRVVGIHALHSYMSEMCANLRQCQFEYLDQLVGQYSAYIKWHMHFSHTRLGNRMITVRGMTHIEFDEKIHYHEDIYDLGQMLYEQLPLLGPATRMLKRRIAHSATH